MITQITFLTKKLYSDAVWREEQFVFEKPYFKTCRVCEYYLYALSSREILWVKVRGDEYARSYRR